MLYLYDKNTIDFTNNGEPIRHSYDEHVVRSEGFYLTFKLLLDFNREYKNIKKEMIISAETPDGRNQFRVYDIVKLKDHVEVVAVQLMYDLDNKMVNPFKVNNVSGTTVINRFISSFKSSLGAFTLSSSVAETHDFSTNDENDDTPSHNALEVLNRITNRWDSELLVNGYDIRMIKRLGTRTNALLYEKKNISNFEDESTVRNMATRIHATSRFIAEGDDEETVISVSVDSPLINEYAQVYEKSFVNNDARTTQELVNWVNLKYSTENIDKPKRNINVSTNIIDGTEINYGDELVLKYLVHDVDEVIRCVGYDYNPVAQTYYSITLGGWKDSFATTLTGGIVDVTQRQVNQIKKNVTHILMNADGYHRNAYGPESVPNPINGDVWYYFEWERPNEIEMRIFEDGFWVPVPFGTKAEVEAAISEAESAKQAAEQAYLDSVAEAERLVDAQTTAFSAEMAIRQGEIQDAKTQADIAAGKANANAEAIFGKLDLATYEANKTAVEIELGKKLATATYNAQKQTQDALIAGKVALTTYNAKMTSLDTAINGTSLRVDELEDGFALTATKTEVDSLKTRLNTAELNITATSNQLALKASQTDLNSATGRLTTAEGRITVNSNAIELRATKTDVNALTGRVTTAEGSITTQAGQIALRATTATVNALTGRVSTAETTISANTTAINLRATKTELTTAINGVQIGGRNLVLNSSKESRSSLVGQYTGNLTQEGNLVYFSDYNVKVGDVLTFRIYLDCTVNTLKGGGARLSIYKPDGTYITAIGNYIEIGKEGYSTVSWKVLDGYNRVSLVIQNSKTAVTTTENVNYREVKLEKGTKATDWTPAPEDVDTAIATVQSNLTVEAGKITALTTRVSGSEVNISNVTQTVSGINTTISTLRTDVNGKATIVSLNEVKSTADGNKTTISNHAGRLTTVETNVSGLQTTVASKASQTQVTQLENSYNVTVGRIATWTNVYMVNTANPTQLTDIKGNPLLTSKSYDVVLGISGTGTITSFIASLISKNSYWQLVIHSQNGTVSNHPYVFLEASGTRAMVGLYEHATLYSVTATISEYMSRESTSLTVLADQINLRVSKGGLMSEINVQAGRTIISTGKLYLDTGSTIMTTAYVNDLKAKSLEAITANITSIRSQVLVTDSVTSTHVKADTAMIDNIFGTTALIDRLTSKAAFITNIKAIDISADKITAGTLNASNVNIINLNVSKIVGLNSTFIQSNWNSATGGQVQSTGNGITATRTSDGTQTRLSSGVVEFWNSTNNKTGEIGVGYNVSDASITGVAINLEYGKEFSVRRKITYGATTFNEIFGVDWNASQFSMRLNMSLHGNDILAVGKVALTNGINMGYSRIEQATGIDFHSGTYVTGSIQAITNSNIGLFSSGNLALGVGNRIDGTTEIMRLGSTRVDVYRSMYINRSSVWGAGQMSFENASATYGNIVNVTGTNDLGLYSAGALYLGVNGGDNYASPFKLQRALLSLSVNLDMGGKAISNQSDRRLKTRISPTLINALSIHRQLNFVDFDWIDKSVSTERQFGLIAQDSPFIGFEGDDGKWNINSSRQIMLNSLGIKELDESVTRIETFTTQHELEIQLLKNRITQLEEKIA